MTLEEARAAAGVPLELERGPYCWSLKGGGELESLALVSTDKAHVDLIEAGGRFATDTSVRIGTTEEDAVRAYAGRIETVNPQERTHRLVVRDPGGIMVLTVDLGKVIGMSAGTPALADEACA